MMHSVIFSALAMTQVGFAQTVNTEQLCADLEEQVVTLFPNTEDATCECTEPSEGALDYSCDFGRVCITAGNSTEEPFSGTVSTSVFLDDVTATTYSKRYVLGICFDYDDLYDGKKVCHESVVEQLGGLGSCSIKVAGDLCELCTFCNVRDEGYNLLSAFDCSNVGGEEARQCTADNAGSEDTIMRFLANPQLSEECEGFDESTDTSSGSVVFASLQSTATVLGLIISFLFV